MPELPEVETVRRGLAPVMEGAVFAAIEARRPDLRIPLPAGFVKRLAGAAVVKLERRGKYMTAALTTGETLIMHLGMTGRFTIHAAKGAVRPGDFEQKAGGSPRHDHVSFWMTGPMGENRIDYNDPRRFGFMDLAATGGLEKSSHFKDMGPEPMGPDFTPARLREGLAGRGAPVKAALLDQSVVAGLGNIYVCEALYRAGISPRRRASGLRAAQIERLHRSIREILDAAIAAGGSTLRDFAASDGALGYFQHRFDVYDREGEPCAVCGAPIRRLVQSGRSTFFCGKCQR